MKFLKAILLCISLGMIAVYLEGQSPSVPAEAPETPYVQTLSINDPPVRRVADQLLCQCGGCTGSVHTCPHGINCSMRSYMLNTIRNGLTAGKTEAEVVSGMVQEYGPRILAEPPREGFTWLGWIMPYIALLLGCGAVAVVIWRWKAKPLEGIGETDVAGDGTVAQTPDQDAELVEKFRAEIDNELAKD